ncbi:MAG: Fic family protein [Deltaproteobacteria bacterium]|nr:Fic family protein [Deltaproteobacteria bacterium]
MLKLYNFTDKTDKSKLSEILSEILDEVNFFHPFREGNGRAQRVFVRLLAQEHGWFLDFEQFDNHDGYERYFVATSRRDKASLTQLILECMTELKQGF